MKKEGYTLKDLEALTQAKVDAVAKMEVIVDQVKSGEKVVGNTAPTQQDWADLYELLRKAVKKLDYTANRAGRIPTKPMPDGEERCRLYLAEAKKFFLDPMPMLKYLAGALSQFGASGIKFVPGDE